MLDRPAPRERCIRLVSLAVAATLLGCGGGSSGPTAPRQWKKEATRMGVVSGFVVDDETGLPIANAQVSVGGMATRSRADGSFDATVPAGRARVEVRTDGFIQTVREVAVGDVALSLPFKLARKEEPRTVGSAGGSYRFREAFLSVPPGVFSDGTMVSLTYLGRVRVAVTSNSPQFIDADHTPRRVVATMDMDASAPPSAPVRVRVPVPTDATMESVRAFTTTASGEWATPIMPISVGAGFAEFDIRTNGRLGVAIDARRADGNRLGYLVTEAGAAAMTAGDVLAGGTEIMTASRAVAVVDPQGTRIEIAPNSRARAEVPAGEMGTASRVAPFAGSAVLAQGSVRVLVAKGDPSLVKLSIQTPTAKLEARGTAFNVSSCEAGPGFVDVLTVVEGIVDAEFGGKTGPVGAGESVTFCSRCMEGEAPMCFVSDAGMTPPDAQMTVVSPDAMPAPDAGIVPPDMGLPPDMAPVLPPDAATAPVDMMAPLPVDAPILQPDAAAPPPDTAMSPPPDAAVPPEDAAVITPDAMAVMPDMAAPMPDMMVLMPDAAVITEDLAAPADASTAKLAINPTAGDYGTVEIGKPSAPIDFTVSNTGGTSSGSFAPYVFGADYFVETHTCFGPLPPQGTCVVRVKLMPASAGTKPGSLQVSATPGGTVTVPLTGYGADAARLEVMPLNAAFLDTAPGTDSQSLFLTVKNAGGLMSGQPTVAVAGADASEFIITNSTCTSPLASGVSCQVTMIFRPGTLIGPKTARLDTSATPGGTASAMLQGNSTFVEVTPANHDFGSVMAGGANMTTADFTIKNIGDTASGGLIYIMATVNGVDKEDFPYGHNCSPGLQPGQTCTVSVDFKPRTAGAKSALLDVAAHSVSGAPHGTDKSALTGTGL